MIPAREILFNIDPYSAVAIYLLMTLPVALAEGTSIWINT